jgi:hypothetical protein
MSSAARERHQKNLRAVAVATNYARRRVRYCAHEGRIVGYRTAPIGESGPYLVIELDEPIAIAWTANHVDPATEVLTAPLRFPDDYAKIMYSSPGRLQLVLMAPGVVLEFLEGPSPL